MRELTQGAFNIPILMIKSTCGNNQKKERVNFLLKSGKLGIIHFRTLEDRVI